MQNPPPPAKNWDYKKRHRCISAANQALSDGKSEQDAIFACIGAAKQGEKQGPDEYDEVSDDASKAFMLLVELYLAGEITKEAFDRDFRQTIYGYLIALANISIKREFTDQEIALLEKFNDQQNEYFDGFLEDIDNMTPARATWRAGLYGYSRHVFTAFTIPFNVVELMPFLPGEDCLGGDLCHCSLEVQTDKEGKILVYWVLDPASESCEVCISHALESPYIFDGS